MSLINQALKRTQLSLRQKKLEKQNAAPAHMPIYSDSNTTKSPTTSKHRVANPFMKRRTSNISFPTLSINKYWVLGALSMLVIGLIGFEFQAHFSSVVKDTKTTFSKIVTHVTVKPKIKPQTMPINTLKLDGTMAMNHTRVALINGTLYHAGESIGGYQIKSIRYNDVLLENKNTHNTYTLIPDFNQ